MTIYRVRSTPGGRDEYGDPVAGTETRKPLPGAFVAPRESEPSEQRGRSGVTVGHTLFAPYGTDLTRHDLVEVDGERWRIEGEVARWEHPMSGWKPGITCALTRGEG